MKFLFGLITGTVALGGLQIGSECRADLYTGTIDQSVLADVSSSYRAFSIFTGTVPVRQAQTLRVGRSGILSQVDLQVNYASTTPIHPLVLSIQTLDASGRPSGTALGTFPIPASEVPLLAGLVPVDVSSAEIIVQPGDSLALVLSTPGPHVYGWVEAGPSYTQGAAWGYSTGPWQLHLFDFGFQTYLTPVPEPGTIQTFAVGIALAACYSQHRTKGR